MAVLTLDEIKTQLKVELDDETRDPELLRLEAVAVDYASQYIGRSIPWLDASDVEVAVPESIKHALLMLISEYDQVREQSVVGVAYTRIPTVENMLHFYRVGLGI